MLSWPQPRAHWMWLAAALLMVAEFLMFDRMTSRHYTKTYPRWDDQVYYLSQVYSGYEDSKAHGLAHGLRTALTQPMPQGLLHQVSSLLVFTVVGSPSRSAALSLNMLAFLAWQAALLYAFSRVGGGWTLGWMAFGLLPCLFRPWSEEAGTAVDFRLDHAAMCLFGVSAAVTLLTRGFRSRGWSVALGLVLCVTLLERFLTSVYLVPLFALSAGWILCGPEKWPRLRNLLFCGLVTALLAGPVFWMNRTALYNYYWVGQVSGAEAAARITAFTPKDSAEFIISYLRHQQLGPWFLRNALGLTLALVALALLSYRTLRTKPGHKIDWDWLFFSLAFFFIPALVLHLHRQKSNVVLGILVPGIILLVGWVWSVLWPRAQGFTRSHPVWSFVPAALGLAALFLGGTFFVGRQLWQPHGAAFLEDARRVNQLADYFYDRSRAGNLSSPRLGVDQVSEAFYAQVMQVVCYERKQVWLPFQGLLPTGILEEKDDIIMDRLRLCDFMLVTDQMPGQGPWPYDRQMRRLYPVVKAWCESNLRHIESFPIFGQQMSLYQRRDLP